LAEDAGVAAVADDVDEVVAELVDEVVAVVADEVVGVVAADADTVTVLVVLVEACAVAPR
jgi:hypothetical protein